MVRHTPAFPRVAPRETPTPGARGVREKEELFADEGRARTDNFPASAAFDAINQALNASEADRKEAIKKGGAVFGFTLKNGSGETESWHIDLKETGKVAKGLPEKPTGMYSPGPPFPFHALPRPPRRHRASTPSTRSHHGRKLTPRPRNSHPPSLGRGLWQAGRRQGQRPAPVHGRQAQDQGRHDEGHEDGAHPQEGAGRREALNASVLRRGWNL